MIIRSGIPAVDQAGTEELGQAIAAITPGSINASNVIGNVLSQFDDAAVIVYDPHTGKCYASSEATQKAALSAAFGESIFCRFNPDAGQTGRSLKWTADVANDFDLEAGATLVTAVKPTFTVESLMSRVLALIAAEEAADPTLSTKQFIVIDQVNKQFTVMRDAAPATVRTALNAIDLDNAAEESVEVTLTPVAGESSPSALPFEGGAV